jgi:hypothetical protein
MMTGAAAESGVCRCPESATFWARKTTAAGAPGVRNPQRFDPRCLTGIRNVLNRNPQRFGGLVNRNPQHDGNQNLQRFFGLSR